MKEEIIILVLSAFFIFMGVHFWQKSNHLLAKGKKANAIIFKNNYKNSSDTGMYYPVVRFLTDKQEWITQELQIGYNPAKKEGTKLEVIYDPNDPATVEINSTFQLKILPGLFIIIGLCGIIFGILELLGITQIIK
jgi:hypothetical protein